MYRKVVKPEQKMQEESKEEEDNAYKQSKKKHLFSDVNSVEQKEK